MKRKSILVSVIVGIVFCALPVSAGVIRVVATYPYIASIGKEIGQDLIVIEALARGDYNPHTIIPKPSYIAKLRNANLLIMNGAQLEIGWLPPLLNQANNASLLPGRPGFLDLSAHVVLMNPSRSVSRGLGDIHPDGNPHYYLDPHAIPLLARAIAKKLGAIDPGNAVRYQKNLDAFLGRWNSRLKVWDAGFGTLKGVRMIAYHRLFDYLFQRYGIVLSGAIEPLPGIPPSARHIAGLERMIATGGITGIVQDVYNPKDAGEYLARKYRIRQVVLPHDVMAVPGAADVFSLFDEILRRLAK